MDVSIAAWRAELAALAPAPAPKQRKQATVPIAEVSGFKAIAETPDVEKVSEVMNALWQRWDAVIVEHGGTIEKHMGGARVGPVGSARVPRG